MRKVFFLEQTILLFLSALLLPLLSAGTAFAQTSFPDIGVVGDHRMMTVVGFAQQSYYFDLFRIGGLQSLGLTFALIGGLLLLLVPRFQRVLNIICYLFLIFVLIIGPAPSKGSLFFYPLAGDKDKWNCPLPKNNTTPMEIMCKMGTDADSAVGTIHDSLSAYAVESKFGAFLPQLVTIHFFTAIERTLIQALWGDETDKLQLTDMYQGITADNIVPDALNGSAQLQYQEKVYGALCAPFAEELNVMLWNIDNDALRNMANRQFTFGDLREANRIFYQEGYAQNDDVYPALGATAYLTKKAYAKSLDGRTEYLKNYNGTVQTIDIIPGVSIQKSINSYVKYRNLIERIESTTIAFPISSNNGTHVFKRVRQCGLGWNDPAWECVKALVGAPNTRDPDPYGYSVNEDGSGIRDNFDEHGLPNYLWTTADLNRSKIPASFSEFDSSVPQLGEASNSDERALMEAMYDYPVQIFFPWWDANSDKFLAAAHSQSGGSGTFLQPRSYLAKAHTNGNWLIDDLQNKGEKNIAVQSCVDLAASIQIRRWKVLEDTGILGEDVEITDVDGLSASDLLHLSSEDFLKEMMGTPMQGVAEQLQRVAKAEVLMRGGSDALDDSAVWQGTFLGYEIPGLNLCKGDTGVTCQSMRAIKSRFNRTLGGDIATTNGVTGKAAYQQGALFNVNHWTAAFGGAVVDIGIMIMTSIQGFVYGAYMKLFPVFISYGIAIILSLTPLLFLMGLIFPPQAAAVIAAPIVGIAFLKTVSIGLILVDHLFIYLMFWVDRTHLSDPGIYKSMLILMHLTASVMLFSIAGFILFGLRDPGAFAKHIGSLDKAGQISWDEALKYGAAPAIAARKIASTAIGATKGASQIAGYTGGMTQKLATERIKSGQAQLLEAQAAGNTGKAEALEKSIDRWGGVNAAASGMLAAGSYVPGFGKSLQDGYYKASKRDGELFRAQQRAGGVRALHDSDPGTAILNSQEAKYASMDRELNKKYDMGGPVKGLAMGAQGSRSMDGIPTEARSLIEKDLSHRIKDPGTLAKKKMELSQRFHAAMVRRKSDGSYNDHYKMASLDQGRHKATLGSLEALREDSGLSSDMERRLRAKGQVHTIGGREFVAFDEDGDVGKVIAHLENGNRRAEIKNPNRDWLFPDSRED